VADVIAATSLRDVEAQSALYARIRAELAQYPGAVITVREFENGPAVDAPIALRLLGDKQTDLDTAALAVETVLKRARGTRDVKNPGRDRRTDLRVQIDRDRAALFGVAVPEIDRSVRLGSAASSPVNIAKTTLKRHIRFA